MRMYITEHTYGSVLCPVGMAGAGEFVSGDQKGALKRRPRHSSGDTTIIPHERLRQSGANGQRERSFGSSPVRPEMRQDSSLPGDN